MGVQIANAVDFIATHARLLERLLFAVRFASADPGKVARQVEAYQNPDGGLGYALEPDVRCAASQPLATEVGLLALRSAGYRDEALALSICEFMERVASPSGLVPILLPSALEAPRAPHWKSTGEPDLNPTAGICGLLHWQGVDHPWLRRATDTCCRMLLDQPPANAHTLVSSARLVEHLPDQSIAGRISEQMARVLPEASFFIPSVPVEGYGMTPLDFARSPESRWGSLFTRQQIQGHLDDLEQRQQADGGWPISWDAPGAAAISEWRGRMTTDAVETLVAYGRVPADRVASCIH